MSRSNISPLLLALLAIFGSQCRRHNDLNQAILTGKLVVSDPCGMSVIQVSSGQIDASRVTASWTNPDNDSVYNNVFKVGGTDIYCNLAAYGLGKGDSLQFELDNNPPKMVCNSCNDTDPPSVPPIFNAIKNVKKLSSSAVTGVLVAQPGCLYVVKIISVPIPDSSVVKSWTDTQNDSTFTNVFTVKDGPAMQLAQVAVGDTFTFTLNGPVPDSLSKYASCDAVTSNVPGVYNNVTDIQLQQ